MSGAAEIEFAGAQAFARAAVALYGVPPQELRHVPPEAQQFSPLIPGSARLEEMDDDAFETFEISAPPGTLERRYSLALALMKLARRGRLIAMAPKDKGGARLADELRSFGCAVETEGRRHYRIVACTKPEELRNVEGALAEGAPRLVESTGFWSQPGIFSWDRIDKGSALLIDTLPRLIGQGADFGAGFGVLARAVLQSQDVGSLLLVDIDRRAIDAARRNVADKRARFVWGDYLDPGFDLQGLDFIVMNPPFHALGHEDRGLGQKAIARAAKTLRRGGRLYLTANRHMPYEAVLAAEFKRFGLNAERDGFKVFEAEA